MIQRIQTIYLLLIAGLMLAMLFLPIASVNTDGVASLFQLRGNAWALVPVCGLTSLLALATVFLYKNRKSQINMCLVILFLLVLAYALLFFLYWLPNRDNFGEITYQIALAFPFVSMVFDLLALSSIRKDEKLVRSADRLR